MFSKRIRGLAILCYCIFFLLSLRLMHIALRNGAAYETMAQNQQKKEITVKKLRYDITDRNGISFTDAGIQKMYLQDKGEITSENSEKTVFSFESSTRAPLIAGHVIGYTSADGTGLCGIEKQYDSYLKDRGNVSLGFMANAGGAPVDNFELKTDEGKAKSGIRLTLDYHIQKIAENVMDKYIKKGAAVILDVDSFNVLAMVSRPSFDSDDISKYSSSSDGELLNRALLGYNAGSVFKIITSAAALEKNPHIKDRYFHCRGSFKLKNNHIFLCNRNTGHGVLSFDDAFSFSCNCAFYITGLETEGTNLINTAADFGIGSRLLNSDIGESRGNLPVRDAYSDAETLNLSIGQGEILITPVQCAVMAATIASGGIRKDVNLVSDFILSDGSLQNAKNTGSTRVTKQSTALIISRMMRECVLHGTAEAASGCSVSIAGKTGSAETGWIKDGNPLVHGWFCGFFPYENPKYAMAILSEGGNSGAGSCVVPFAEICEEIGKIYPYK